MEVRIDKWLWAVRLFKTRAMATEACRLGKVRFESSAVKPSKTVKEGDVYELTIEQVHRTVRVKQLLNNRVGARLVCDFMEDLTPEEEYDRIRVAREFAFEKRDRGIGRPSKRDRRKLEQFKQS
ncbi:MAG TPA: RNA-binding S4 domain-containing protein [Candidatus Onthomorpha intestinigallinarum]|uniref:RNA-binding S4 domain-containing protein n=1 Tax=Candidatus Onthomorpha intestinigallinarum TaxID=2840880 RepID=A0A9D1UH94_9BACT|nr:RNA-binding S4 domain-containing protein [Candidatus Onthomorpha intestinigallinarum]